MTEAEFATNAKRRPLKAALYEKMDQDGFPEGESRRALDDIRKTALRMDRMLVGNGGPWLLGEQLTLANMFVAPLIDRMEDLGFGRLWDEAFSAVAKLLTRIQQGLTYRQAS